MNNDILIVEINEQRSSLISKIEYHEDNKDMYVYFRKYYTEKLCYINVQKDVFLQFIKEQSIGKFYLHFIKNHFITKQVNKMADRPKTKNVASDQKRFIKISINVQEIIKDWIHGGAKGAYLNCTLHMLPDGELDKFGNLGFITQDVPKVVYEKDKSAKGPILGNAAELDWSNRSEEGIPGAETGNLLTEDQLDELPF